MKKYQLATCTGVNKSFDYLQDLIDLLATDKITELTDNEICLLSAGMDIEKKDNYDRLMYTVKIIPA